MVIKAKFNIEKNSEPRMNIPAVSRQGFSCAGESCRTKDKCERWDHIYTDKYVPFQQLTIEASQIQMN